MYIFCIEQLQHLHQSQFHIDMADTEDLEQAERSPRTQVPIRLQNNDSRLSIPFGVRLPATATLSFLIGAGLGVSHGSQVAAYRFRAENAHRLPTSPTGWYLYHKSKNYRMAYAGIGEAFKMGAKLSIWTSTFFAIEGLLDSQLMRKDFTNTVVASLTTAGLFSAWSMLFPRSRSPDRGPCANCDRRRPIYAPHGRANVKNWTGGWISIWVGTRCGGSSSGTSSGICGVHSTTNRPPHELTASPRRRRRLLKRYTTVPPSTTWYFQNPICPSLRWSEPSADPKSQCARPKRGARISGPPLCRLGSVQADKL